MSQAALDKVLSCTTLPSLPGVAMRVLELTRDANVSLASLSEAVQPDPALVTKVLKTVNSSYYGLSHPCPSIQRAMSMLGLNTVKSIVLGFSLVDFTKSFNGVGGSFDMQAYWRRAIFSAAGARAVAKQIRQVEPEEAFVGALVSDIGMLASLAALREEYLQATKDAPEDHDELAVIERQFLTFDHTQAGRELALKWRMPEQLVACIGYHHDVDKAHPSHADLVRCVALGRHLAASLTMKESKRKLGQFILRSREWFSLDNDTAKRLVTATNTGAAELGKLFEVRTGASGNVDAILAEAQEQLVMSQVQLARVNEQLTRKTVTDALTQSFNRAFFEEELRATLDRAKSEQRPYSIIFLDCDRFKRINDTFGHASGDAVLRELARRMREVVGDDGSVCRYGGEEFAVLLPGMDARRAQDLAEKIRLRMESAPFTLDASDPQLPTLPVTISAGVATAQPATDGATVDSLMQAADQAVYAAKKSGRNRVCIGRVGQSPTNLDGTTPQPADDRREAPSTPGPNPRAAVARDGKFQVLILETDPLAAKLLSVLFGKRPEMTVTFATTMEMALAATSAARKPDLVLADPRAGASAENVAAQLRAAVGPARCCIVLMLLQATDTARAAALAGGATIALAKQDLANAFDSTIAMVVQKSLALRLAA